CNLPRVKDERSALVLTRLACVQLSRVVERGPSLRKPLRRVGNAQTRPHALSLRRGRNVRDRASSRVRKVREKPLMRESLEPGETVLGRRLRHITVSPGARGED